jgi:hypothetical protein
MIFASVLDDYDPKQLFIHSDWFQKSLERKVDGNVSSRKEYRGCRESGWMMMVEAMKRVE